VLKRILPHLAEDDHFVTMFRDEADLASKLIHKNVCHVYAFGEFAGTWFIAMEYLHGVPLSRMMTRLSKAAKMLDVRMVAGIIIQACEGLHAAHEAKDGNGNPLNVVHRDVSPPNMMVCGDGTVKLLDFGIAKARGANSRTRTGTVKGKNAYMSPEQILGKPLDRRSDVFALAIVMYEMLAIKRLFHRDSDFLTFKAITEEPIPDIRERRPDLPPGMRAALIQAMARDPNGRFDTALSFANAIKNSLATLGGPASPNDLARLLFTDFGDEMSARDEILKAADDPLPTPPIGNLATPPQGTMPVRRRSPSQPPPIPVAARSGELSDMRRHHSSQRMPAVAPVILGESSGPKPMATPAPSSDTSPLALPALPAGVLDLSRNVPADTWMADPETDLLKGHRMKGLRNVAIALGIFALIAVGVFVLVNTQDDGSRAHGRPRRASDDRASKLVLDAGPAVEVDAAGTMSQDDIIALSRYGFFSITASAKTTIYIDGKLVGETPLTRLPLKPGPYKVKAVGPRGKSKQFSVNIYATKDTDQGAIVWDKER
ncbi:MAG TPA: protein kinase, partial [Kofleriaceae bacterium]|nr:protein kinase [Kofleriaceae bacterium]